MTRMNAEGWRARVNGEDRPVARSEPIFQQVELPAGQATVEFVALSRTDHTPGIADVPEITPVVGSMVYVERVLSRFATIARRGAGAGCGAGAGGG